MVLIALLLAGANVTTAGLTESYAHSGRTDAQGGHKDNKNKSGLGSYHYHCGGNPPHLHDGGVCPYGAGASAEPAPAPTPEPAPKPERVTVSEAPTEMKAGSSQGFTYSVENGTSSEVTVESSNPDVIMVNSDHTLKAVGAGEASIKVSSANASETFTVVVKTVEAENVKVDKKTLEIEIGGEGILFASVEPADATDQTLSWTSSDESIATVSDGKVRAKKEGSTVITVETVNGKKTEIPVSVTCIEVESVKIDDSELDYIEERVIDEKSEVKLTAKVSPGDATYPDITWSSSDKNVIKVEDGEFEITGKGKAVLTASAENGITDKIEIEVISKSERTIKSVGGIGVAAVAAGVLVVFFKKRKKRI